MRSHCVTPVKHLGQFSCTLYLAGGNYPWHPWYYPNLPGFNSFSATALPSLGSEQFPGKGAGLRSVPRRLGPFLVWTHDPSLQASPGRVLAPCWPSRLGISILIQLYLILTWSSFFKIHKHHPPAELCHQLSPCVASHVLQLIRSWEIHAGFANPDTFASCKAVALLTE